MTDLLIAIDGTNAKDYRRSWVKIFYESFAKDNKHVIKVYNDQITQNFGKNNRDVIKIYNNEITTPGTECDVIYNSMKSYIESVISNYGEEKVRLSIIGHSRGGYVAMALANSIKYKTHFLGLLDPVNMRISFDGFHDTSKIDHNKAGHIFYAKRDDSFAIDAALARGSLVTTLYSDTRIYFGYALDATEPPKVYRTSHGGIGGDPFPKEENFSWYKNITGYFNDVTCKATVLRKPIYSSKTTVQESLKICEDESLRVWTDLREFVKRPEVNLPL